VATLSVREQEELRREGARDLGATEVVGRTPRQLFWVRFRRDKVALVALAFLVLLILAAILAGPITRAVAHPPNAQFPNALDPQFGTPTGPSSTFPFGVDKVGEDVFSRVLYGARVSLEVAFLATFLSVAIGVVLGMLAGYYRGWVDTLISRVIDVTLAFPILLLALGIGSACSLGKGCVNNSNWPQLNDPRINALMARAETIVDPQQRFAAWARIDQLVTETAVAIPWLWETFPTLFSSNVTKVPELWNLGAPDVTFMEVTG
jgi:ABC-type dipeptide/oligopeptide/nickel transport system permease subunit